MRIARVLIPLALAVTPLAATTPAHADIISNCGGHQIEVHVYGYACVGADYPWIQ